MNDWISLPGGIEIYFAVLRALGPITGYLVIRYLFKNKNDTTYNTFLGNDPARSILALVIIPIMMTILGVRNESEYNAHYYGFLFSTTLIIYAIFEEYGWRGYLQNALAPLGRLAQIVLVALLWYIWHLNFLYQNMSVGQHLVHAGFLVLGAWGLLEISNRTASIAFASAVHLSFNLLTDAKGEFLQRIIVLAASIVIWIILVKSYRNKRRPLST